MNDANMSGEMTPLDLEDAPIVEVVCGVHFLPLIALDILEIGALRERLRTQFPKHQLQPTLHEAPALFEPLGDARVWLVSSDDQYLVQLQRDRFFFNWRRVPNAPYPRFGDREGRQGVRSRALAAFRQLDDFARERFGASIRPSACELAKVDHLDEGVAWKDPDDLGRLLPVLQPSMAMRRSEEPTFQFAIEDSVPFDGGTARLTTRIASAKRAQPGGQVIRTVTLETRFVGEVASSDRIDDVFVAGDKFVDDLFVTLIPTEERIRRFKGRSS